MKVVFISPDFDNYVMSVECSSTNLIEAIETLVEKKKKDIDLSFSSFIKFYSDYHVYIVEDNNLYHQGTLSELMINTW